LNLRRYSLGNAGAARLLAAPNRPLQAGAVQVDSINIRVESANGFSAWNWNMTNRYQTLLSISACAAAAGAGGPVVRRVRAARGGAVQVEPYQNPCWKRLWCQCLKQKNDNLLSGFAFNFNLRRYTVDDKQRVEMDKSVILLGGAVQVEHYQNPSWKRAWCL
jgi:hypothetical protein